MRKAIFVTAIAALAASSFAVKIVTTTPDLASIAAAIGGNNVSVTSILVGARDPHHIEAKPSYMSRVAGADLFIATGLELEIGYEAAILEGSRNAKVQIGAPNHLYSSDWVTVLDKPAGAVSRAQGDIHPYGNPHVWLDPYNGRIIAVHIEEKLAAIDSKNAGSYKANLASFLNRLDTAMFGSALVSKYGGSKLWEMQRSGALAQRLGGDARELGGWAATMAAVAGKPIVTYHSSFTYFANRFGLRVVDELEPKPGLDPTPGHLAQVMQTIKANGVKAIVQESFYPTKHAEFVASRTGAKVVVVPQNVGHDRAATDYISLIDTLVSRISGALR